jgi:hypothetical protein
MIKLNGKELLAKAEEQGQVYRVKSGWRKLMVFAAVLMCLLVILIPLGIWFFYISRTARLGITDEGFALKWFGTKAWAWSDIEAFRQAPLNFGSGGAGLVGALAGAVASEVVSRKTQGLNGPLSFKLKGKKLWRAFPAHAIERSFEMAEEMERRTGLEILPRTPEAELKAAA